MNNCDVNKTCDPNKTCELCGLSFKYISQLQRHKNNKTPCTIKNTTCNICNLILPSKSKLFEHIKICKTNNIIINNKITYEYLTNIIRKDISYIEEALGNRLCNASIHEINILSNFIKNNINAEILSESYKIKLKHMSKIIHDFALSSPNKHIILSIIELINIPTNEIVKII